MSAFIKIWNPQTRPLQISEEGHFVAGMSEAEVNATDPYVQRLLEHGTISVLKGVVPPVDESQVADSTEIAAEPVAEVEIEADVPAEAEVTVEEEAKPTKATRPKTQASKES